MPFVYIVYQVNPCEASIIERSGSFRLGSNAHNHVAEVGATLAASITAKVKAKAAVDIFRPASVIVEAVLLEVPEGRPLPVFAEAGIHSPSCQPTLTAPETTRSNRP